MMVMNMGDHVSVLDLTRLEKLIPDSVFREEVLSACVAKDVKREFDVKVETMVGVLLQSTFTAGALVELSNQVWIKSITKDTVARLC